MLDAAVRQVGEAVRLDNEKRYQEALNQYVDAIQKFLHVIKCEAVTPRMCHERSVCSGAVALRRDTPSFSFD